MFDNVAFKSMESSLEALAMKQKIHTNNIANISTPGFKTQSITFANVLANADGTPSDKYDFKATVATDPNSVLPDGNNVSIDKEETELYKTYVQTVALYQQVSTALKNTRYVINNTLK